MDTLDALQADLAEQLEQHPGALVVACSGGADSVALAALTARLAPTRTRLVHIEHGWTDTGPRMAEAVVDLGMRLRCPTQCIPLPPLPRERAGVEGAARAARYTALAEAADGDTVLTAHTLDDDTETLAMRLARGTGLHGLAGIRTSVTVHGARLWRPLLAHRRATLRAFLVQHGIPWVEDPTNEDLDRTRNHARHIALPALVTLGSEAALARTTRVLRSDAEAFRWWTERELQRLKWPHDAADDAADDATAVWLDTAALRALPEAVQRAVIHAASAELGASVDEAAVARIRELVTAKPGQAATGRKLRAERGWHVVRLEACEDPRRPQRWGKPALPVAVVPGEVARFGEWSTQWLRDDVTGGDLTLRDVVGRLALRSARGDERLVDATGRDRTCGEWAADAARSAWRAEQLVALADDDGILALLGCRLSGRASRGATACTGIRLRVGPRHSVLAFAADRPTFAR